MTRMQIIGLFLCNLLFATIGNQIMPLLPLFVQKMGAETSVIGLYFGAAFTAQVISTLAAGWFATRYASTLRFIRLASVGSVPFVVLMGLAQNLGQLVIFTVVLWALFGLATTMINILIAVKARGSQRGRSFGLTVTAMALGQFIGGMTSGPIVQTWGYVALFVEMGLIYALILPITFMLTDGAPIPAASAVANTNVPAHVKPDDSPNNWSVMILSLASVIGFIAYYMVDMIRPLAMDARHFDLATISQIVALGGIVNLPLPFVLGWLSDRFGRHATLMTCYALAALGMMVLTSASEVWHFQLAQILLVSMQSTRSLGMALVTDLSTKRQLGTHLSRYQATVRIGAVFGFITSGFILQLLGVSLTFMLGMVIVSFALPLVFSTRTNAREVIAARAMLITQTQEIALVK